MYELYGDSYVEGNLDLDPEEGVGFELGYGAVSIFRYESNESISYVPGYSTEVTTTTTELDSEATLFVDPEDETNNGPGIGCVLNPNWNENDATTFGIPGCIYQIVSNTEYIWNMARYENTGEYTTQGIRYSNVFGPVSVMLNYTDTDQPRVPEYAGVIAYEQSFKDFLFKLKYAVQLNREPGQYDFLPEGQEFLEDLEKLDFYITKEFSNGVTLAFKVENLTDEVVEVTPYYDTRGRELNLTLGYKW